MLSKQTSTRRIAPRKVPIARVTFISKVITEADYYAFSFQGSIANLIPLSTTEFESSMIFGRNAEGISITQSNFRTKYWVLARLRLYLASSEEDIDMQVSTRKAQSEYAFKCIDLTMRSPWVI